MCIPWVETNVLSPAFTAVSSGAEYVRSGAENCAHWLDKQITDLTRTALSPKVAVVADAMIRSLPFLVMGLFCTTPFLLAGIGAVVVYKMKTTPEGESITMPSVQNGLGFAGIILGGRMISQGIGLNALSTSIFGIGEIIGSLLLLLQTDFIKNLGEALPSLPAAPARQQKAAEEEMLKEPSTVAPKDVAQGERGDSVQQPQVQTLEALSPSAQ